MVFRCVRCDGNNQIIIQKCVDRKFDTKLELPFEIVNDSGELELWFHYNEKYDLYQTYNNGRIYHQELQLSGKSTPRTGANRANCSKFVFELILDFQFIATLFSYLLDEVNWYNCPYTVTEDEHAVNITLESFLRKTIYSIDKSTNDVAFIESESGLYGPSNIIDKTGFYFWFVRKVYF